MAVRRNTAPPKVIPAWLLQPWRDRDAEAQTLIAELGVSSMLLHRYRVHLKAPERFPLKAAEQREVSSWQIEGEPEHGIQ